MQAGGGSAGEARPETDRCFSATAHVPPPQRLAKLVAPGQELGLAEPPPPPQVPSFSPLWAAGSQEDKLGRGCLGGGPKSDPDVPPTGSAPHTTAPGCSSRRVTPTPKSTPAPASPSCGTGRTPSWCSGFPGLLGLVRPLGGPQGRAGRAVLGPLTERAGVGQGLGSAGHRCWTWGAAAEAGLALTPQASPSPQTHPASQGPALPGRSLAADPSLPAPPFWAQTSLESWGFLVAALEAVGGARGQLTCSLPQQLELDSKFRNHTCGLCGDYNGLQSYSEFLSDGEARRAWWGQGGLRAPRCPS